MAATGRNAPCPCGSGNKYKLCCLSKDDPSFQLDSTSRRIALAATTAPRTSSPPPRRRRRRRTSSGLRRAPTNYPIGSMEDDGLDHLSNSVVDHIEGGRFDEAEAGINRLRQEFPEMIDWLDRAAMLAEAHGDSKAAADLYRRCVAFTYANDGFDDESRSWMIDKIKALDPEGPPPPGPPGSGTG